MHKVTRMDACSMVTSESFEARTVRLVYDRSILKT